MEASVNNKTGSAGSEGVDYQLNLLLITLLRADKKYGKYFLIYSEWKPVAKLDDVVFVYQDDLNKEHYHFLQAKYVANEKKTVNYEDLISSKIFNIERYFNSFKVMEKEFEGRIDNLILFTNLALNKDVMSFVEAIPVEHPIFHFQEDKINGSVPIMHKLNAKFLEAYEYSTLRRIVKTFLGYCFKNIKIKKTNNNFKCCHIIMSTDVVNVVENKFRDDFIDGSLGKFFWMNWLVAVMHIHYQICKPVMNG